MVEKRMKNKTIKTLIIGFVFVLFTIDVTGYSGYSRFDNLWARGWLNVSEDLTVGNGTIVIDIYYDGDIFFNISDSLRFNNKICIGCLSTPTYDLEVIGDVSLNNTLYVLNNGNVGIGTTDPQTKLQVNGTANAWGLAVNNTLVCTSDGINCPAGSSDQNLWETITASSGSTTADSATDTLYIYGSDNISTSISGDTLTIAFNKTCEQITGGAGLCDGTDAVGGAGVGMWRDDGTFISPNSSFASIVNASTITSNWATNITDGNVYAALYYRGGIELASIYVAIADLGNYANMTDLIANETTRVDLIIGTYIPNNISAKDECSEITNCVDNAWDADGDISNDEISEAKINFATACAAGNYYRLTGNDLECTTPTDTTIANETPRFDTLVGTDCTGTDKMTGVDADGTPVCEADAAGGAGMWRDDGNFISPNSSFASIINASTFTSNWKTNITDGNIITDNITSNYYNNRIWNTTTVDGAFLITEVFG